MPEEEKKGKKDLEIEKLEVTELEDEDLEDVAGGVTDTGCGPNTGCNVGCPKPTE
ncbi:MAG TPA: hypothetical protein VN999_01485 [Thermoanaerobaculia bacterium]|nr:hypothetical protein [Thermoanaerobaculia bacterium]